MKFRLRTLIVVGLVIWVLVFLASTFMAFDDIENGVLLNKNEDGNSYYVSGVSLDEGQTVVEIPAEHKGKPVTRIAAGACKSEDGITEVIIPESIVSIEERAFYNCIALEKVSISGNNATIAEQAFSECTALKNVVFGGGVASIGKAAFSDCTALCAISLNEGLQTIESYAFENCTGLQSVVISDTVVTIGKSAFFGCKVLSSLTIGNSVHEIGASAFAQCYNLENVKIPASVTSIGEGAFSDCDALNRIYIANLSMWCGQDYPLGNPNGAFELYVDDEILTELVVPNDVTRIGNGAFYNCDSIVSVQISDSVTVIEWNAFERCRNLEKVEIGKSVANIERNPFQYCENLGSIVVSAQNEKYLGSGNCVVSVDSGSLIIGCNNTVIPNDGTVTYISDNAFVGYKRLKAIRFPASVTGVGGYALFANCDGLESLTVDPENKVFYAAGNCIITLDTEYLIAGCKSSVIPQRVKSITNYAFADCTELESIKIPYGVEEIGECAFMGCTKLQEVELPTSLMAIYDHAFDETVYISYKGTMEQWSLVTTSVNFRENIIHCTDGDY